MLERHHEPLLSVGRFALRVLCFAGASSVLILVALSIGVAGYHWIAGYAWVDALLNASMILAGMGQVDALQGDAAKIFASAYALFSGIIFITVAGLLFAPLMHRILHHYHAE